MRSPKEIAIDILAEWKNINKLSAGYGCLIEMLEISDISIEGVNPPSRGNKNVIRNFLGSCQTFRSSDDTATKLKNELRELVGIKKVKKRRKKTKN